MKLRRLMQMPVEDTAYQTAALCVTLLSQRHKRKYDISYWFEGWPSA